MGGGSGRAPTHGLHIEVGGAESRASVITVVPPMLLRLRSFPLLVMGLAVVPLVLTGVAGTLLGDKNHGRGAPGGSSNKVKASFQAGLVPSRPSRDARPWLGL